MAYILSFLNSIYTEISNFLVPYITWYGMVVLILIMYLVINHYLDKPKIKEKKKQTKILEEMDKFIEQYEETDKENVSEKQMTFVERFMKYTSIYSKNTEEKNQEIRKKGLELVKKHNGKPWIILFVFFIRVTVFLSIIWYLQSVDSMPNMIVLPVITAILTFLINMTRKRYVFSIIISGLSFWIYTYFSGAANIFMLLFWTYQFIMMKVISRKANKQN